MLKGIFTSGLLVVTSITEFAFGDGRRDNLDSREPSNRFRVGAASKSNGLIGDKSVFLLFLKEDNRFEAGVVALDG
jgi:hypothetical protein